MANIFWTKRDTDNWKRALGSTRGFLHRLNISWTLVHKQLKIGSEFSPTLRKFCIVLPTCCTRKPNPTKRCQMGRNKWRWCEPKRWRRIITVNVTIKIRSLVYVAPKHFKLAMTSRWTAFSGNTSLIATFSSFLLSQYWQTDRRTELRQQYRALHYMQSHGKNGQRHSGIEEQVHKRHASDSYRIRDERQCGHTHTSDTQRINNGKPTWLTYMLTSTYNLITGGATAGIKITQVSNFAVWFMD